MTAAEAFDQVCAYTLTHGGRAFIHQHVVDAYAAQTADAHTKPIKLAFALVGLHLLCEKQFSGRQVQRVHMVLAKQSRRWPAFPPPRDRGAITAADVLAAPAGARRDATIHAWCAAVWAAYRDCHRPVAELLRAHGFE
ncbi:MAG TPA: DUF5946 family protein [Opitutaceae bacterium]|nr:DUF5946 family protein [Opitutaceae bacterium]